MSDARRILKLNPSDALDLQDRARRGDVAAAQEFFLYSLWLKIKSAKQFSAKDKIKSFLALAQSMTVEVVHG